MSSEDILVSKFKTQWIKQVTEIAQDQSQPKIPTIMSMTFFGLLMSYPWPSPIVDKIDPNCDCNMNLVLKTQPFT